MIFRKGVFQPKNLDTLRPEMREFIGLDLYWSYMWRHDSGEYTGQAVYWAFTEPKYRINLQAFSYWVPECDIEWEEKHEAAK